VGICPHRHDRYAGRTSLYGSLNFYGYPEKSLDLRPSARSGYIPSSASFPALSTDKTIGLPVSGKDQPASLGDPHLTVKLGAALFGLSLCERGERFGAFLGPAAKSIL